MKIFVQASFGALLLAFIFVGLSQAQTDKIEESYKVKPGGTLYLNSDVGSVDVKSHNSDTVEVEVEKKGANAEKFTVSIKQDDTDIKISGDQDGSFFSNFANVRFKIKVPENYNVQLRTSGGSIELADLIGKVDVYTSGGSIELGRIKGDVEAKTSGGSIRVEDVAGNIDAHTSGGSIVAKISKQPSENCRLKTSGGSVTAYLAPSVAVDLNASTSGGRVRSEFDVDGSINKTKIKGTINGGGPDLVLKTSGGSVNVKKI